MRRFTRLAIAAGSALAALVLAGPALAAYSPSLYVTSQRVTPGQPTAIILGHVQSGSDDPTAKDTIYAPPGYGVNLTQPLNAKIGDVSARLILRQGGNAEVDVDGEVIVDDPALHPNDPCAPGLHQAVWKLNITVAGTPLTVYVYVDTVTAGPEAAFASAKIQLCLAGPIGTPAGAQLLFAFFDVNGVFTNPSSTARRIWRGVFTPYTPGTPNPNPAGTTEGQAVVPGAVSLSVKTKSLTRGRVIITGRLLVDGQPLRGALVEFYRAGRETPAFRVRTNATGRFTVRRKIKKRTRWTAQILLLGDLTAPPCPAPGIPGIPQGCKTATLSFFVSRSVTARFRR